MNSSSLILNDDDSRVVKARNAERDLLSYYKLEAKTRYVPFGDSGYKIRVTEIGNGKPVVLVPGNTGDVFPLIPLMARLTDRRIIAINRPGGGMSDSMDHRNIDFRKFAVQTVISVLDELKLDKVPIIAHSIGGHMSILTAIDHPERVSTLVLLGVPGNLINTSPPVALRALSIPGLNSLLYKLVMPKKPDKSLESLRFMGHSSERLTKLPSEFSDCYYYFQQLPNYKISSLSLMRRINSMRGSQPDVLLHKEELNQVKQPVMFLWGTNDPFGTIEIGRKVASCFQQAEFHAIQDAGHLPWLDRPEECGSLAM
ncbi:Pimeloyl-ACP methyl ester carboxylesterase [Paenibacillus algorifonticola]|uniref:Pimeloyl-ACP methyl ester carboxylesterase n=1 Tax=Paenibacillus algorifonticola TaxID=684063 RepID=A0A1I1YZQ4_9BACL|nr:alpha/beta hydrolase [Paenibacillus algorifonticola]SFE24802.1 Pimeloyl-ACP methyl ester carboxylesterase [Paenibacillus algorifonticola]